VSSLGRQSLTRRRWGGSPWLRSQTDRDTGNLGEAHPTRQPHRGHLGGVWAGDRIERARLLAEPLPRSDATRDLSRSGRHPTEDLPDHPTGAVDLGQTLLETLEVERTTGRGRPRAAAKSWPAGRAPEPAFAPPENGIQRSPRRPVPLRVPPQPSRPNRPGDGDHAPAKSPGVGIRPNSPDQIHRVKSGRPRAFPSVIDGPRRARHSGPQVSLGRRVLNSGQRADASAARHPRRGVLARHRRRVETAFSGNRDWPGSPVPEEGAPAGWERLNWKRTPRARAVASSQQASGCDGSPDPQSRRSGARGDGGIGGGVTAETRHTADSPPSMRST